MRQNVVLVSLLVLLAVLGSALVLGASKTRAAARALIEGHASEAASAASAASASAAPSGSASATPPAPSASAKPPPSPADRSLGVVGLGWDEISPALLAAGGTRTTTSGAFATEDVRVSIAVSSSMVDVERSLAIGGGAEGGADIAVLPLSEFVASHERLRALDLRIFFVGGWSQGRDVLTGTPLPKLPASGKITLEHDAGADSLAFALFLLDLSGVDVGRVAIAEHRADATLHAIHRDANRKLTTQEELVASSREASRLLPYVMVAPRPLLEDRDVVVVAFLRAWLAGADSVLKDRARAARTIAAFDGAPEALGLLHDLGDLEPIRLRENAELLGLSGRGALSLEALVEQSFRVRRAAHLSGAAIPDQPVVDGRIVARLARSSPKLILPPDAAKRPSQVGTSTVLAKTFQKDDEEPVLDALGVLATVFPRSDVRLSVAGQTPKGLTEWIDRAVERYDVDRARLVPSSTPPRNARVLIEVLRAP